MNTGHIGPAHFPPVVAKIVFTAAPIRPSSRRYLTLELKLNLSWYSPQICIIKSS